MPIQIPAKERCDWPSLAPHLIVGPDGQLSRLPFEMLLVSKPGGPPRYLVEEKTINYVGSGREVARLAPGADLNAKAQSPWPLPSRWSWGIRILNWIWGARASRALLRTSRAQRTGWKRAASNSGRRPALPALS